MEMWMDVDAAVTVPVNLMPLLDSADFVTRETSVAYNASGMDLVWNFVTTAGVITQTAVTPTTGGDYDWTHVGDGIYKIEIPASGGASINNDTEGYGWFSGVASGVLPWRGPVVGFRSAEVNNSLVDGNGLVTAAEVATAVRTELTSELNDVTQTAIDTTELLARISSTLFTGITSLAEWLGLIAGKQTGDSTARTELRATGAGSGTFDETTDSVEAIRDNMGTAQTGDAYARLGAPAGASVSADVAAVKVDTAAILVDTGTTLQAELDGIQADTEDIQSRLPAALVGGRIDATIDATGLEAGALALINAEVDTALADYDAPTKAELDAGLAGLNDPTAAAIADAVWTEAIADHEGTVGSTAEALSDAGAAGTPPTVGEIADAVWDEDLTGHTTTDSAGEILGNVATGTPPTAAAIADAVWDEAQADHVSAGSFGLIASEIADTLADTNELQGDWANGGRLDLILDARSSQSSVDDLPTNSELTTALGTLNDLDSTEVQTAAAAALTAYDPPTKAELDSAVSPLATQSSVDDVPTNAELATALAAADDAVLAAIAALNNISAADVNAQVVDALATDTYAEPGSVPAATATLAAKIGWLAALARNKVTQTSNTQTLRNDADSGNIATATVSDDGTTFTKAEWS